MNSGCPNEGPHSCFQLPHILVIGNDQIGSGEPFAPGRLSAHPGLRVFCGHSSRHEPRQAHFVCAVDHETAPTVPKRALQQRNLHSNSVWNSLHTLFDDAEDMRVCDVPEFSQRGLVFEDDCGQLRTIDFSVDDDLGPAAGDGSECWPSPGEHFVTDRVAIHSEEPMRLQQSSHDRLAGADAAAHNPLRPVWNHGLER